jgi:hypothetical protein
MGDKEAAWVCEALGDFLGFESGKMQPVPRGETGAGRADAFQAIMDASRGQGLFMPVHSGCVYGNKQDQARGFMVKPPQDRSSELTPDKVELNRKLGILHVSSGEWDASYTRKQAEVGTCTHRTCVLTSPLSTP